MANRSFTPRCRFPKKAGDELLAEERSLVADSSQVSAENLRGIQRREIMHVHGRDFLCGTVGAIGGEALSNFSICLVLVRPAAKKIRASEVPSVFGVARRLGFPKNPSRGGKGGIRTVK